MCGIVGVAGDLTLGHIKIFKDLLIMDVLRGEDSTGVLQVDARKDTYDIARCSGHPCNLWEKCTKDSLFGWDGLISYESRILLGHNRYTTSGSSWIKDPHPFDFENVVGVHNGTLTSTWDLHDEKKYDIDSEALYSEIDKNGIEVAWEKLWGAAALVFWDKKEDTINLIRNSERTLYYLHDEEKGILYWASEAWMITSAIHRSKTVLQPKTKSSTGVISNKLPMLLTEDTLYTFKNDKEDKVYEVEKKKLKKASGGYGVGITTNYKSSSSYNPQKNKNLSTKMRINLDWTKGNDKGDKTYRGQEFYVTFCFVRFVGSHQQYIVSGRMKDTGEKILIFPETYGEYWEYSDAIDKLRSTGVLPRDAGCDGVLLSRPRVMYGEEDHYAENGSKCVLGIQSNNVKMSKVFQETVEKGKVLKYPLVQIPNDVFFQQVSNSNEDLKVFQQKLCDAGQACCWCGEVLSLDKPEETKWYDDYTPLCIPCHEADKNYQLGNQYYGAM